MKTKKQDKKIKEIENILIKIAIDIAKDKEGALFVVGDNIKYNALLKQNVSSFSIFEKSSTKLLKSLGMIDGAVIIDREGFILAYGAMIKGARPFLGYGTRHAAALTASKKGNISIMCSEEEQKIKIFRNGKYIMQIDALQKNVEKEVNKITNLLESIGAGFLGTLGAATLAPALWVALIPGVVVFGSSYYLLKKILSKK